MVWDKNQPDQPARMIGEGDRAAWSPNAKVLFSEVRDSQSTGLVAYDRDTNRLSLPMLHFRAIYMDGMGFRVQCMVGWPIS